MDSRPSGNERCGVRDLKQVRQAVANSDSEKNDTEKTVHGVAAAAPKRAGPWSPLSIIATFVLLVETVATTSLTTVQEKPFAIYLVWFVIVFPVAIATVFFVILWRRRWVLFGPMDFKDDKTFADLLKHDIRSEVSQAVGRSETVQVLGIESLTERVESLEQLIAAAAAPQQVAPSPEAAGVSGAETSVPRAKERTADKAWKNQELWGADPNKGRFGGSPEAHGRVLEATITPVSPRSAACRVTIAVKSTDPRRPLSGLVRFYLHPTFGRYTAYDVDVVDGVASDAFTSWGAFTVGAEADKGTTKLELDLVTVSGGTPRFYAQ